MGYLIEGYKIMGQELRQGIVKHRAGIATGVSIVGTILSNVMSTKAGAKSARMIDQKEIELGRTLTFWEKTKLCWTNHVGSAAVAATSVAGAQFSHNTHVQDFNKLGMAYSGLKKLYDSGKQATREVLGEKKAAELQDKLNAKKMEADPTVPQKIQQMGVNPDPHTQQRYWEPIAGEFIWSTKDKIELAVKCMVAEMDGLKPRQKHVFGRSGEYGVRLRRFYELAAPGQIPPEKLEGKVFDWGFNKGKEEDGSDDDAIDVYYTPMLINNTSESCIAINWYTEPSDMTYGDLVKC